MKNSTFNCLPFFSLLFFFFKEKLNAAWGQNTQTKEFYLHNEA